MIRGSIWALLHSSGKSLTVREPTIIWAAVWASPTSAEASWMLVPAEGLNRLTQIRTQAAATAPVPRKVATVPPRIFPRRFMLAMLPTAQAMDTKTRGTTMVKSRFRKISPMGFRVWPKPGEITPMREPMAMPPRRRMGVLYCCQRDCFPVCVATITSPFLVSFVSLLLPPAGA